MRGKAAHPWLYISEYDIFFLGEKYRRFQLNIMQLYSQKLEEAESRFKNRNKDEPLSPVCALLSLTLWSLLSISILNILIENGCWKIVSYKRYIIYFWIQGGCWSGKNRKFGEIQCILLVRKNQGIFIKCTRSGF